MKTKLIYSTAILFSFVIYSCNNESVGANQTQHNASTFTSFQDLRNSLKPNPYVKTLDPSISFSITGPGGTTITCTGNSIIDSSGNTVSYDVDISLYEFNTLDEMILAKAPTTYNGNLLVSGGSFEVTVENTATGEELEFTNWGCQCSLDIQTSPS